MQPKVKRSRFFLLFGSIWILFAIPFLLFGIYEIKRELRYQAESATTEGVVIGKSTETKRNSDNKGSTTYYYIDYRFSLRDGSNLEGRSSIDSEKWRTLERDSAVDIQYFPNEPETNRLASQPSFIGGILMCAFAGLCMLIGLFSIVFDLKKARAFKRIMEQGQPAQATVTEVRTGNVSVNNVRQWVVAYSFKDFKGQNHTAVSEHMSPEAANQWKPGDQGQIRYLTNEPNKSIWIGR